MLKDDWKKIGTGKGEELRDEQVNRRDFLGTALAGAAAGALVTGCGPDAGREGAGAPTVQAAPNVMWRCASSFPRGLDTLFGSAQRLSQYVENLTEGRFQVRVYPAGELVPGLQVMDAVQQGTVQLGHTASYYFTGKNPVLAFDTCVPFGLTSRQQSAWLHEAGGLELVHELYSDFGIITFPAGNTGAQMGGWFKREIQTAADLRGLKMRIPGLGGEVMARLGVTVQVLAGGDIFPALERGTIDATEWVGPYDDEKLGLHAAAEYYYYPGWWEPGPSMTFQVNLDAWNRLPTVYQEAFRLAARSAAAAMQTDYDSRNPPALERLLAEGVELRRFSDDIMTAARQAAVEHLEENAARDSTYGRVYQAWKEFRDSSFRWFGTAEQAYAAFSFSR
jgi:TRAP-type mannitol/chloroaromatic compound transport system substrate-binding protein